MNLADLVKSGGIGINYISPDTNQNTLAGVQFLQAPAAQQTQATNTAAPNYSGAVLSAINAQMGNLDTRKNQAMTGLESQYGQSQRELESNRLTGTENLNRQKETTTRQRNMSIKDLSQNIRNAYQSGINRLGVAGASDSSASNMYKYALGQQEAQNRGQINSDYNYNLGNIDLAYTQLQRNFKDKLDSLNLWKTQQAADIANKFQDARNQLEMQRAQYGGGYVNQAQSQLAQNAISQLANLSVQVGDASKLIANDFATTEAQLKSYQPVNTNPDVAMQSNTMSQNSALQMANPTLYKKYNEVPL